MNLENQTLTIDFSEVNSLITCSLCKGYLINATAINECPHTFCKSCIVKHLQNHKSCPECNTVVHETNPFLALVSDRPLQEIVYQIVPNLYNKERQRESDFYHSRGMSFVQSGSHLLRIENGDQNKNIQNPEMESKPATKFHECKHINVAHSYKFDSKIMIKFQPLLKLSNHPTKYILCPSRAPVKFIKKIVAKMLELPSDEKVQLICVDEELDETICARNVAILYHNSLKEPETFAVVSYKVKS